MRRQLYNCCQHSRGVLAGLGFLATVALLVLVMLSPSGVLAKCGEFYRVQSGDTLQVIARRQMQNDEYEAIFRANAEILKNPSLIEVGQLLYLPCPGEATKRSAALAKAGIRPTRRDNLGARLAGANADAPAEVKVANDTTATAAPGTKTATAKETETGTGKTALTITATAPRKAPASTDVKAAATEADPVTDAASPGATLRVLTGSDIMPLASRDLPSGGMAMVILNEALEAAADPRRVEPAFVDDWKSHLPVLMPTGAFPLAAPWPRPDCASAELSASSRTLCETFLFSEAFYEMPVSLVVPVGSALVDARSESALRDLVICRPEGFPPVDLERLLVPVQILGARTAAACSHLVADGKADAVSLPDHAANALLIDRTAARPLMKARYLTISVPVHVVAWRGDPSAAELIGTIDEGLARIQKSGRWMDVIAFYLRTAELLPADK